MAFESRVMKAKKTIFVFTHQRVMKLHGIQKIKSASFGNNRSPKTAAAPASWNSAPQRPEPRMAYGAFLGGSFSDKRITFSRIQSFSVNWGASKLTSGAKRLYTFVISIFLHRFFLSGAAFLEEISSRSRGQGHNQSPFSNIKETFGW